MLPDRVSNHGPLTYESGALPIALRGLMKISYIADKTPYILHKVSYIRYLIYLRYLI